MKVEEFEFSYKHASGAYAIKVQRFLVDGERHLWTRVQAPRAEEEAYTYYENADGSISWRPMNDKRRDELLKLIEKPLGKKLQDLKKQGKLTGL